MSVSSRDRRQLYDDLETAIGTQAADTLMQLLPFHPADELVTRADMHAQTLALKGEMAEFRAEIKGELSDFRSEIKGEIAAVNTRLSEVRTELKGDILGLENRFEQRFTQLQVSTQRLISASIAANAIAVVTALVA